MDLLHEFELGVWKALFVHLIRILVAQGGTAIQEFNGRYVTLPYSVLYQTHHQQVSTGGDFWQVHNSTL